MSPKSQRTAQQALIASVDLRCSEEVLTVISMLSAQNIFYRPREKQAAADAKAGAETVFRMEKRLAELEAKGDKRQAKVDLPPVPAATRQP